jgi:hypothetical protein
MAPKRDGPWLAKRGAKRAGPHTIKKRWKKRRFKIPKPLYGASKQQKQVLATNLNMASLKLVQLFQS